MESRSLTFQPKSIRRKDLKQRWRGLYFDLVKPSVIRNYLGRPIYVNPNDRRARKIFVKREPVYRPDLATWLELVGLADWTDIVDVGANYGEFLTAIASPQERILTAFEPNPDVFRNLASTCSANGLAVNLENTAIGNESGEIRFYISERSSGISSLTETHAGRSRMITAPQTTLERHFTDKYGASLGERRFLIKIDIEGHDLEAIAGLGTLVESAGDIAVLFELSHSKEDLAPLLGRFAIFALSYTGEWIEIGPPADGETMRKLKREFGFNDAVLVRKTSPSSARDKLVSLRN